MRVLTVSQLKEKHPGGRRAAYPGDNTASGRILAKLRSAPGRSVNIGRSDEANRYQAIEMLRNMYGFDIRQARNRNCYILAGEWFGSHYVDYVDAAIDAAIEQSKAA